MTHINELQDKVAPEMKLPELVNAFEKVALHWEGDEEYDCLFEYGNFDFTGEELLNFGLTLQWPNEEGDEYVQLHLDILYELQVIVDDYGDSTWAFEFDSYHDFFKAIRENFVYKYLVENDVPIKAIDVWEEET